MSDSKLILVVDDDTDLVEMVSMKLESKFSCCQSI